MLQAFDALDVTNELWSSDAEASDMLGSIAKFAPPTVANGRVFVGTASNQLVVYGLLAGNPAPGVVAPDGGTDASGSGSGDADAGPDAPAEASSAAPTWSQIYALYIGPGTPGHCSGTGGCHTTTHGGFQCGATKSDCFQGLVSAGLVTPANGTRIADRHRRSIAARVARRRHASRQRRAEPAAAAAVQAWVAAGALEN